MTVSRRAFVPLATLALVGLAFGFPTGSAHAAQAKAPTLEIWVVTASKNEPPDAGRVVPAELSKWGELNSDPLGKYGKFELVDHVTTPIDKQKPYKYAIKGETSVFDISFLGAEEDPKAKGVVSYSYRITFPSPDGKGTETLHRVTKPGERTIIRDRGFKHHKGAVRFIAFSVGP